MIEVSISQQQWSEWQTTLDLISGLSAYGGALLVLDSHDELRIRLSSGVDVEEPTAALAQELLSLADQVYQSVATVCVQEPRSEIQWQDCSHVSGYFALPLLWPSKAVFGVLCLFRSANNTVVDSGETPAALTDESQRLLQLCRDSIEHQLIDIYRQHRRIDRHPSGTFNHVDSEILQLFINSFKEHVWMKNVTGQYVICNYSVELAWNKSRDEIIGRTDEELFGAKMAKEFAQADNEAIKKGRQITASVCQGSDLDRRMSWLETTKVPFVNAEGDLGGIIGITRNISKHKAAEEQLELAARVFEHSVEGVLVTDRNANIIDVYGAFSDITGYTREQVIGKNPRIFSSGRHDREFYAHLWQTLLKTGKWHGEIWNLRNNGAIFPQLLTISSMYDDQDNIRYFVAVFADITLQKQSEEQLANLAYHDPLTQLPNRITITAQIEQEIRHADRQHLQLAIVFIDVDFFKHINDSFGHLVGDDILVELAQRLADKLGPEDGIARIAGDEFVVLLPGIEGSDAAALVVSQLRQAFELPFSVGAKEQIRLTASMGISLYPDDGKDSDTLLTNADAAMHRAKLDGRNSYAFYTESLTVKSIEHLKLQSALHDALEKQAFYLVYQPKVDFQRHKTMGFEALLRWNDPLLGHISPAIFIPVAEKIGLIHDIGLWVLRSACQQGVIWLKQGKRFGRIAVNVAGQQIQRSSFVDDVKKVLLDTGLPPNCLELEVTESFMMLDPDAAIRDLRLLGKLGIELSIDDFGTGYSSLNYLKRLPIHKLKIDQSFVRDIPFDLNNTAIAKAIIVMGHALNLKVIAEGVETQQQADFLTANACDEAQGYLFSKPRLPEDLEPFLTASE